MLTLLLLIGCGTRLERAANPDIGDYPSLPGLDADILEQMALDKIPGLAACAIKDGALAWCQGYGYADIDADRLVTPETPFLLASVSKAVAGMALMKAVEDGQLSLDAPINDTLGFPVSHPSDGTAITARHLAAHASGIKDNWDVAESLYSVGDPTISLGSFLEGYLVPGGTHYAASGNFVGSGVAQRGVYSNVGAGLMGHLVESAVDKDFAAYCREELFAPLGLEHTAWYLSGLDVDTLAVPYEVRLGRYKAVEHYGFPDYPSGQLRSSAEDISRLLMVVMSGGEPILSRASVESMLTVQYSDLDSDQGLSFYRWKLGGDTVWGHNGGEVGAATEVLFWQDEGIGVVVLMNGEGYGQTLPWIEKRIFAAAADL